MHPAVPAAGKTLKNSLCRHRCGLLCFAWENDRFGRKRHFARFFPIFIQKLIDSPREQGIMKLVCCIY